VRGRAGTTTMAIAALIKPGDASRPSSTQRCGLIELALPPICSARPIRMCEVWVHDTLGCPTRRRSGTLSHRRVGTLDIGAPIVPNL
jgi:hypothetical protein